uniref:Potassium channel domain-containing protein n=1 Tax=Meloidogyne enterolobii TaxID=390850 RepID=A0A6V7WFV9_MELEN|nr:unnamed protein product [Meloidogyne enterolobii]
MFFHSPLQKPVQPRRRSTLGQPDVAVEAALRQQLAEVFSPQSLLKVEVLEPEDGQSNESTPLLLQMEEQDTQNNNLPQQQQIPPSILVSSSSMEKSISSQELAGMANLANNNNLNINKKHRTSNSKVFPNTATSTQTVRTIVLRRPTITIQEDGRILIDNITARWEGFPMPKQQNLLDGDDVGTLLTSQLEGDEEGKAPLTCTQKIIKYIKILVPHIVLVAVLIGYLCLGASILQALETRTELVARSRKLVRLNNMIENFTIESWKIFGSNKTINNPENWAIVFRDYMVKVAQEVDERRPIQQELLAPERLDNIHNKWTFPTALLYVLTVLTTCGYSEVSVNTDVGKIFSVIFALVGIPLMFITAADIGKFLSDTLLRIIAEWKLMTRRVKRIAYDLFYAQKSGKLRRKSLQSISVSLGALELADIGSKDDTNLWFPIGAYVLCICVYCSFGSIMFMNWEEKWSFIHSFHFGFNLIVTVGLGDIVVTDYLFLSLIVAFVIVGLAVVTMCVDLASTHLKNYFAKIHYFGRAKRFLGMSEELREIVTLLGVLKRKKHGKITLDDVCNFLENELYNRAYEPHELLRKLRFIDENTLSSTLSTMRHNSFQSDFLRDAEYLRRLRALRPDQPVYL